MTKQKRVATKVAVGIFGALLLALPGLVGAQKEGGTLTVGLETDVRGFDGVKGGVLGASGGAVARTIAEPLLAIEPKTGKLLPHLAVSWSSSNDLKTWTFRLRQGVRFHDGTPFTAKDVADNWNRILNPKNRARSRAFLTPIKGAMALDAHTVRFELAHPWMSFPAIFSPPAIFSLIPSHKAVEAGTQNRHPVGTGPFRFKSWAGGDRIVVERNPDYWDPGRAHLERIIFRILPDTQARFASLKAGDVDVIWTDRGTSIRQAEKDSNIVVLSRDGKGAEITFLNASKPPLDDARVRQAISHAMNQQAGLEVSDKNTRPFARHPFGVDSKCDSHYREYDPERAKKLLADYGKPVTVEMLHTTTARGREGGAIAQQFLKEVGITLKLIPLDQNTLIKGVFTNEYMISPWRIGDANDVGAQLFALTFSKSPYNLSRYKNPALDKVALAFRTAPTQEKRAALGCTLVQMINESATMLYRAGNRYHALTRANVKNVTFDILGVVRVGEAWKE